MPFIGFPQQILGFKITKRLGLPNMCGWSVCGWSECGDDNDFNGEYQQRRPRIGNGLNEPIIFGKPKNFARRPIWPEQPASEARDAQQTKFKNALLAWQALTESQKQAYNTYASRLSRRGYDYFMSKTLKS